MAAFMTRRSARLLLALALAAPGSCFLFHSNNSGEQHSGPAIHTYTDSNAVRGVAMSSDSVYVATERGLLKYPVAGGEPVRISHADGLPSDDIYAVSSTFAGAVWVVTRGGIAKLTTGTWTAAGDPQAQPDVGRPTAILALDGGGALLGGAQGLAR